MLTRILGGLAMTVATTSIAWSQTTPPPAPLPKGKPAATKPALPKEVAPPAVKTDPAKPGTGVEVPPAPSTAASTMLTQPCAPIPAGTCAPCCIPCGPPGRFWVDASYIFWTTSGQHAPPLVTTSPDGTPREIAGVLGQPGTSILYPTGSLNNDWRSGIALSFGMWCDCCQTRGFEANFFYLGQSQDRYRASCCDCGDGNSIIGRPFFNTTLGIQDDEIVCYPGILSGAVQVSSQTDLWGFNPNYIRNLCCGPCGRVDLLLGFYYISLKDNLVINESLVSEAGQLNVQEGTRFRIEDRFQTSNSFYAGNIGLAYERRWSHWYAGVRGGAAFGSVHQTVEISGFTVITPPGLAGNTYAGGLLTQPSNIGTYERDQFAVMPWINLKLGCQVTQCMRVYAGLDWMYLSNTVRAGEQIDTRVNTTQIAPRTDPVVGPLYPAFQFKDSGTHIYGVRIGAEFRF